LHKRKMREGGTNIIGNDWSSLPEVEEKIRRHCRVKTQNLVKGTYRIPNDYKEPFKGEGPRWRKGGKKRRGL